MAIHGNKCGAVIKIFCFGNVLLTMPQLNGNKHESINKKKIAKVDENIFFIFQKNYYDVYNYKFIVLYSDLHVCMLTLESRCIPVVLRGVIYYLNQDNCYD